MHVRPERLELTSLLADPSLEPTLRAYHGHRFGLNRCRACAFMQPSVLPAREDYFAALYNLAWSQDWMVEDFELGYKDLIFDTILAELGSLRTGPGSRLLDIGTHVGRMLAFAHRAGWQPVGIDMNPRTVAFAAARTGMDVRRTNAKDLVATGEAFDAVVMTDVLEHIPDPVNVLLRVRDLLRPNGWVAIKVPCGVSQSRKQWLRHAFSPRHDRGIATNFVHLNHFGVRSMLHALRRGGFESIRIQVGAPELPQARGAGAIASRALRRAVYAVARTIPYGVHSPFTLNLQAYARKPLS